MSAPFQFRSVVAQVAIAAYLIIKHGTVDNSAALATSSADALIGANEALGKDLGEVVDYPTAGTGEVVLGAAVTRGDPLTADATSRAVTAAPGAGVNARIIGFALQSGVAGDVVDYQIAPGRIQG
jgi:hypothetical protein